MTLEDGPPHEAEEIAIGYRKPPRATRFRKGQSGNPAGQPRWRNREARYDAVIGRMAAIRGWHQGREATARGRGRRNRHHRIGTGGEPPIGARAAANG